MKKIHALALPLLLVLLRPVAAQEEDLTVKQITDRVQRRYEMIDDAVVQFEQHVKFGFSDIEQTFDGVLTMKKPNRYRVESEHQTIVTDGTTVWAYSAANKQVIVDRYKENSNSISPEKFMLNLPDNYYVSILETKKDPAGAIVVLKLIPKDDRSFVKSVKLTIEVRTWIVRTIDILDVNETETVYTVRNIKLNTNVGDKSFTFETPPGADVVDLRDNH